MIVSLSVCGIDFVVASLLGPGLSSVPLSSSTNSQSEIPAGPQANEAEGGKGEEGKEEFTQSGHLSESR